MKHYVFYEGKLIGEFQGAIHQVVGELPHDCYIYRQDGKWFYCDYIPTPVAQRAVPKEAQAMALVL